MKRSEVLTILENLIRDTEYIDIPNEYYYKPKELAEEILNAIETAGMLPPEVKRVTKPFNWLQGVHEWESEDETK